MPHKNGNNVVGNFCVYDIHVDEELQKYGKADSGRITQSSELPTRLHQQVRDLQKNEENVVGRVIVELPNVTTRYAKDVEDGFISDYLSQHGSLPPGNKRKQNNKKP